MNRRDNAERTAEFADALFAQARGATSLQRYPTELGKEMLECAGRMPAPDGRRPWIRTVWLVRNDDVAELVTAFPDRERDGGPP